MFNGDVSGRVTAKQRRAVDWQGLYAKHCPEEYEREQALLEKGGEWIDDIMVCKRGLELAHRTLLPPKSLIEEHTKDVGILFCHGYTDNLRWIALRRMFVGFAERGYMVTGVEVEGHGLSDYISGLILDIHKATEDILEFAAMQQKAYPRKKWFIAGESMGGMFALLTTFLAQKSDIVKFDGMVLLSPMCKIAKEVQPPKFLINALIGMSKRFPKLSIVPSKFDDNLVFKNKEFIKLQDKDPIRYHGKPRLATGATMYQATMELEKRLDEIELPFIVLHGKGDIVTTYTASVEVYEKSVKVAKSDKQLCLIEGAWHNLLSGEAPEDIARHWNTITDWLKDRTLRH